MTDRIVMGAAVGERRPFAQYRTALVTGIVAAVSAYAAILLGRAAGIATLWPVNGLVFAVLIRSSRGPHAPIVGTAMAGIALANVVAGNSAPVSVALALCNGFEIVIALSLARHWLPAIRRAGRQTSSHVLLVLALIGCAASVLSGTLATAVITLAWHAPPLTTWIEWFASDALGMLVFAPVILSFDAPQARAFLAGPKRLEMAAATVIATGVTYTVFAQDRYPFLFLVIPALLVPAFRLGFVATAILSNIVSLIAVCLTVGGHGPIMLVAGTADPFQILVLQAFVAVVNLTALPLASAFEERRQAESRLAHLAGLKQALFDSVGHGIIATDEAGTITQFNAAAARLLACPAAAAVSRKGIVDFLDREELARRAKTLTARLNRDVAPGFDVVKAEAELSTDEADWHMIDASGRRLPTRMSFAAIRGANALDSGYVIVAHDMSERLALDRAIEKSRLRLIRILDSIPAMVAYWGADMRNQFANRAYVDWFGKAPDQIMTGLHIGEVIGAELLAKNRPFLDKVLRGEPVRFEREIVSPDGRRRYSQAHYIPDVDDGKVLGFYVLVFDVSQIKASEAALQQAKEEAERATRAKSDFLASMSHELRTPLNSVMGFSDLLGSGQCGPLNAEQTQYTQQIMLNAEHLLALINDVLELSRIECGRLNLSIEPVLISPVIKSVIAALRPLADKTLVIMSEEYCGTPPPVAADRIRLDQILINLGSNAIKYNRPGGRVEFGCEELPGERLRIIVRDNGPGIPLERQAELFEAFNRLGAESGPVEGTGIGLTLSKRLVEMMNGRIGFESTAGKGSRFWIDLPIDRTGNAAEPDPIRSGDPFTIPRLPSGRTLLYVEDNPSNLLLMRNYMRLVPGVDFIEASDGIDGLRVARAQIPDLILLDINLPGLDGYEVLAALRSDPSTAHIPVVALTANAMQGDRTRARAAGFDSYLAKPARLKDFLEVLSTLLADDGRPSDPEEGQGGKQ